MNTLEVYNEGDANCPHSFIYSSLSEIIIKNGLSFKTKRICELCGRYELTLENMKYGKVDGYYEVLSNFGLEVK